MEYPIMRYMCVQIYISIMTEMLSCKTSVLLSKIVSQQPKEKNPLKGIQL